MNCNALLIGSETFLLMFGGDAHHCFLSGVISGDKRRLSAPVLLILQGFFCFFSTVIRLWL